MARPGVSSGLRALYIAQPLFDKDSCQNRSMTQPATPTRSYRGVSQEERRADRRSRLIAAAVEVYGERGYRQASVKAVCEAAGLTERYFYESFANSEELLIASYNAVTYGLFNQIKKATQDSTASRSERARAMLDAYFTALKNEPRSAQLFLVEIRGVSPLVDEAFNQAVRSIAREVMEVLATSKSKSDELLAVGIVGGISQIALHWIQQGYALPIREVIDAAMRLGSALLSQR